MIVLFLFVASLLAAAECRTHSRCYGSLGCFTFDSHLPLPQDPSHIRARTNLYDRQHTHTPSASVTAEQFDSEIRTFGQRFHASKPTKIIIHGFLDKPTTAWIGQTRDALLQKVRKRYLINHTHVKPFSNHNPKRKESDILT